MSSIKKYVGGDTKEWLKFGETNALPNEISSASNISVDFGDCSSVNSILYSQQQDIEKLKRNVSWLALHGGGGSGGSGGGTVARKASCTILINGISKEVAITEGQTVYVTLSNFKGSSTSVPWKVTMTFDGSAIYTGSKTQGSQTTITIPIAWSSISRFFEGTGKTKNHLMSVLATYHDDETSLDGSVQLDSYVYIPTITCVFTARDSYNVNHAATELTATLAIDTALMGTFKLKMTSTAYDKELVYDSFEFNKTTDSATFVIDNFIDAFKVEGEPQYGVYSSIIQLYHEDTSTGTLQLAYQTTRQIIIFSDAVDLLVNFTGLSPYPDDERRTEVYDNVKNLLFSFYAFKNGATEYDYTISLKDETDPTADDIVVIPSRSGVFGATVTINKIVNELKSNHRYTVVFQITPTRPEGPTQLFYGYIKCIQGQFSFITYSNDGEKNRIFALDPFNSVINTNGLSTTLAITSKTSDASYIGENHPVSAYLHFSQINPRSGLIADDDNVKAIRLYDTYLDIDNGFKFTNEVGGEPIVTTTRIQDHKQFTICLCYQTQTYTSNDHVVFALCNRGFEDQGIVVKNDGIYVKGSKVLTIYGDRLVTVHIVYNNESGTSVTNWGPESCYKIYVNGVITYISDKCPFVQQEVEVEGTSVLSVQNDYLSASMNGFTSWGSATRQKLCNCDIYDVEIMKGVMNEIDILASFVNNKVRTTYKDYSPDFSIIQSEMMKNCCTYNVEEHTITSDMYPTTGAERKFVFTNVLLNAAGEVPSTTQTEEKEKWISKLSSLSLPITYIDIRGSSSPTASDWTFDNFKKKGDQLKDNVVATKFYYWDPSTGEMPISSDSVELKTQGTSTQEDFIKNVEIKFNTIDKSGTIVQDLLFVRSDWIPENSYVLKADMVDSSHANNASIGKFINEQFKKDNGFGFGFDEKGIASTNITQTTTALRDNQRWNIEPQLKHTVEGFQTLLLIRFFDTEFINLGIYSFNIGRNAARNLGFEYITSITNESGDAVTDLAAPVILKNVIVNTMNEEEVFWVENSNSQNFSGISAWTPTTNSITPDPAGTKTEANPDYNCRFWHCRQGTVEEDTKLNQLFETKYYNTLAKVYPAGITTFDNFVSQVSKLPIEGLLKTTSLDHNLPQIIGGYTTYKYNDAAGGWTRLAEAHNLKADQLEPADVNSFDPVQMASYYVIALMFGLVDNLDKNISFRVFGESKLLADFYDMDTALGLNNVGLEDVSPTVGVKLVSNYKNVLDQDYPYETFNTEIVKSMYPKYSKLLPETYTNKLWLSLDSNSMRTFNGISYSLYASLWFKLRQYLDKVAADAGFSTVADFFVDKYFGSQVNCGTFIYNYDYTMKYLNDYNQTGKKQEFNTISKLHGRRIDEVRAWLKNHIDFLDSYFYWRGHYTYTDGSKVVPAGLNTVVSKKVSITSSSKNNQIEIETEHPVIIHSSSTADGDEVGDTLTVDDQPKSIKVSGGSTDKPMALNCSSLLKNFDLVSLGAKMFRAQDGSKITFLEELILDGLNIVADGISMNDFIDTTKQEVNVLSKISMRGTKFSQSFDLDLTDFRFLNVSYVDIKNSSNVNSLRFYSNSYDSTTQNLKYLDVGGSSIENLTLKNQSYLVLPNINTCDHLATLTIRDCNLNNIGGSRTALSNYMNINLSGQTTLKSINLQNVEHVKSISIKKCQSFENMTLKNISALTALTLDYNSSLKSLEIYNCPELRNIHITHCYSMNDLDLLSVNNLTNLNLDYDYSLSSLRASEGSVSAIQYLNLRNVNISGIGYYNEAQQKFDDIIEDPRGNKVLDFKPFKSLRTDGLTIRKNATGDYTADKCANFLAIRFPNDPTKAFPILDRNRDDVGVRFSNLKNIYGHVKTQSNCEWSSGEQLFLNDGDTYKGYPPFLTAFMKNGTVDVDISLLKSNTFFDLMESKCATMKTVLSGRNDLLSAESYIVDGFLSCTADGINEFDTREWATNYTVPTLYFVCETKGSLDQFWMQYLMYRYAISQRANQISKTKSEIHGLGYYFPSAAGSIIQFPDNTFKFFGNTMSDIRMVFRSLPSGYKYKITYDLMKWLPEMKTYAGLANADILYWNALSGCSQLTTLGNYDAGAYYTSEAVRELAGEDGDCDYGPAFISSVPNLKQINYFSPAVTNFYLSGCQLPSGLTTFGNSFTKFDSSQIIDISSLIGNCTQLQNFYGSLNSARLIIKPTALKNNSKLKWLQFNDVTKYLVEDRIDLSNFLCSYVEEESTYRIRDSYDPEDPVEYTSYTQSMFTEFVNNIFKTNTELTTTNRALANMYLPYKNVQEGEYTDLELNGNLLKNNTKIQSLENFMKNVYFRYTLAPEMFRNLTAITNMYGAFQNVPSLGRGIASSIPARFFYTGSASNATLTCVGTDRFDKYVASYSDFKTNVRNSYVPTSTKAGTASYTWDILSTGLDSAGLLNVVAFNDVSSTYLTGEHEFVDLPTQLTTYQDKCPLVSNILSDDGETVYQVITPGAEPLVNTLCMINMKLSANQTGWEQHVCGLSTTTLTYPTFRRTIANVNYCFAGNCNIKPYSGAISTENNAEYNPFFLNYTAARQSFATNINRNSKRLDDQWSSNGAIWKWSNVIDDWEVDTSNYNADHNNATTPELSVLSSNSEQVKDLSGQGGAEISYDNVDSYKRAGFRNSSLVEHYLVEYMLKKDQVQEFKYICAPDLFRYCNSGIQTLNYVFASCDNFSNSASLTFGSDKEAANVGLTGRIPPNLLKPLPSLKDITGLFKKCSHMTGYQGRGADGEIHSYLIPGDLFVQTPNIYNFNEAFLGTAIKYNPDFELPFSNILAGASSNGTKLQVNSTFAWCIWCYVKTMIKNVFTGKYFSNIDYTFKCTNGTSSRSVNNPNPITNAGTLIGNRPQFRVFTATKYVPELITQTYYGSRGGASDMFIIDGTDVARNTLTTDATVRPAK